MNAPSQKTGVLLINLGTPDSPETGDVRRYLREFLSDPRVLDMPAVARWLLLNLIILPTRPRKSAAAYRKIWMPEGSPLLIYSEELTAGVTEELGANYTVELGMRYGKPSIASAAEKLAAAGVDRLVAVTLFPQYSEAANGSAIACLEQAWKRLGEPAPLEIVESFYDDPGYIGPYVDIAKPLIEEFRADHVMLSYHGLPEKPLRNGLGAGHCLDSTDCCEQPGVAARYNCYRAQCYATSRALMSGLDVTTDNCTTTFQSRLKGSKWIEPYTDVYVETLAERGVRRLAVLCPAFVADCLETVEEIGIRLRDQWIALGGEDLLLVPCVNGSRAFAGSVADWVRTAATKL